jgi:hypothetical protein
MISHELVLSRRREKDFFMKKLFTFKWLSRGLGVAERLSALTIKGG